MDYSRIEDFRREADSLLGSIRSEPGSITFSHRFPSPSFNSGNRNDIHRNTGFYNANKVKTPAVTYSFND